MKVINTLIAPPGSGKTTWLINHISQISDQCSVLAFPTKILSLEVQRRLESMNLAHNPINSSTVEGSVTQCLEESLNSRNDRIIICTHESLQLINPETLKGWFLYIDEVPSTWSCTTCSFSNLSYHAVFDSIIDIVSHNDKNQVKVKETKKHLVEDLASGSDSTLSTDACKILRALLDERCVVEVDKLDAKKNRTMRIIGVKHYTPAFEAAEATFIMGAEIEKTLLGIILKGAGWSIVPIEAELDFQGYGNKVVIHPFFSNKNYSKSAALMKNGKNNKEYQKNCLLDAWLAVDVFRVIGNRKAILVAHDWCRPELPIPQGSEVSNVRSIPIDNRGINDYGDYRVAICLQHGNITPIENRSLSTLAELLSSKAKISADEAKNAVKYERFYESTFQSVCRTALRSKTNDGPILLFVQDLEIANFLATKIGSCQIDETYSEVYVPPISSAKAARADLQRTAVELWEEKIDIKVISQKVRKTERTVREWLKPYRELQRLE